MVTSVGKRRTACNELVFRGGVPVCGQVAPEVEVQALLRLVDDQMLEVGLGCAAGISRGVCPGIVATYPVCGLRWLDSERPQTAFTHAGLRLDIQTLGASMVQSIAVVVVGPSAVQVATGRTNRQSGVGRRSMNSRSSTCALPR